MPFSVGTFYKSRISTLGVNRESREQAVSIPDPDLSETEELEDRLKKQFIGFLALMGTIKYSQYRMYWSPGTRIPAIADKVPLARFEKLKRFFHVNALFM